MKKVAFICPLYDKENHFDLAFNLYKSKHDLHIKEEIYFIFSDEVQKEKFRSRIYEVFYLQTFGKQLFAYLNDGNYDIDNSIAERFIRLLAGERKNMLFLQAVAWPTKVKNHD